MLRLPQKSIALIQLVCALIALVAVGPQNVRASPFPSRITAATAHEAALAGKLVLVDIRTAEEWRDSGVPASGHAISMHQDQKGFLRALDQATGSDKTRPIALICAVGNRSANLQAWLQRAGYTAVVDVAEGMIGGRHGRGWVKSGLPVRAWHAGASVAPAGR